MTNTQSFNLKKKLLTNKEVKTETWPISPTPSSNTTTEYLTPKRLGLRHLLMKSHVLFLKMREHVLSHYLSLFRALTSSKVQNTLCAE